MGYQTGTSTGPSDLLDKLRLFLIDQGWTVNKWDVDNSKYATGGHYDGTGKRLHIQKTATDGTVMYFNLRSTVAGLPFSDYDQYAFYDAGDGRYTCEVTGLAMNGSTGYNGSLAWDKQPGGNLRGSLSWGVCMTPLSTTAIPSYHFFQDGDTVVMVVEYTAGKYQWFCFGCLEKQGTYTGGQFFSGSLQSYQPTTQIYSVGTNRTFFFNQQISVPGNGAVYLNVDGVAEWRASGNHGNTGTAAGANSLLMSGQQAEETVANKSSYSSVNDTLTGFFYSRSPNFYNALAPFAPVYFLGKRASANYAMLGYPKSIRHINATNYAPAAEINLSTDIWMVFPEHSVLQPDPSIGFVVKKVV